MRAIRDLWNELIERRLWPIPIALLAALVAVPTLLAKPAFESDAGSAPSTPAPVAAAAAAQAPDAPVVSVAAVGEAPQAPLRGHEKDPFRQQHVPPKPKQAGSASVTGTTTTPSAGTTPSNGGNGGGAQPKIYLSASIDVHFGPAAGSLRSIRDVPRLTPLPNTAHPVVVFLGMRRDLATAVFLVSTDVHAQGDGSCVPSRRLCQAIELREGDVAFLDVAAASGRVTQYELDLDAVTLHQTTSKAAAQASYARVSRRGARWLKRSVRSSARNTGATERRLRIPFHYAAGSGVLHIAPWASKSARAARAHGAVSDARLSDLPPSRP
jgi:hypothetical protein